MQTRGFGARAGARSAVAVAGTVLACVAALPAQDDFYLADAQAVERYLDTGKLSRAEALLEELVLDIDESEPAYRPGPAIQQRVRAAQVRLALMRGERDRAKGLLASPAAPWRETRPMRLLAAELYRETGRYGNAIDEYAALVEADGDDFRARCEQGLLQAYTGDDAAAEQSFEAVVEASQRVSARSAEALTWIARAMIELGGRDNIERASGLLIEALRVDDEYWPARFELGRLRHEVYGEAQGYPHGEEELQKILDRHGDVEPVLVELYRQRRGNHRLSGAKTEEFLARALQRNPNSVPALTERGITQLDNRRFEDGVDVLDRALVINPRDKHALAQRAAAATLLGDTTSAERFRKRIADVDATDPIADLALGDRLVRLYRFEDALEPYRSVLDRHPEHVEALHGLARALVYSGQGEEAARILEKAKEHQPGYVNPWRNNQLALQELLDEEYREIDLDGFHFFLHRDDIDVLSAYLVPYHQQARQVLGRKYGWYPDGRVRVEVFHTWDDFSVRTIGYRGFTALGACFGPLITLVSPRDADLRRNDFPWTATVWHEYTHVLTLALSDARIPRWWTEGFSVYEEGARDPSWERGMTRELLDAWHNGEIPPVLALNGYFRDPSKVLFGYFLSGEVVEMLAEDFGFDELVDTLPLYAEDKTTEQVFGEALGVSMTEIDRRFRLRVLARVEGLEIEPRWSDQAIAGLQGRVARDPRDLDARIHLAWAYVQRANEIDAGTQLRRVAQIDPDNARASLVRASLAAGRGDLDAAMELWRDGFAGGADDFDSRIRYGDALRDAGRTDDAIEQYRAAARCWPDCTELATAPALRLARVYRQTGRRDRAMEELRGFVALTGRAFEPRMELAEHARERGDRKAELALLEECNRIDPFHRGLHLQLADAYLEFGRRSEAVRELRVALAVRPDLDRANVGSDEVPSVDDRANREQRAEICLRIARLLREIGAEDEVRPYLERAIREAPDSAAAREAERLLDG